MAYWNSRGLRGSTLEELINRTNEQYREDGLALVEKIPTPIKPVKLDNKNRNISLAYFEKKSTVDYIGVVQGIPICFDAKETSKEFLPLQNIHEHQIKFMSDFEKQKGISFLIVFFVKYNEYYYLPFSVLREYWIGSLNGKRKSIPYSSFDKKYIIKGRSGYFIHYLEAIKNQLIEEP